MKSFFHDWWQALRLPWSNHIRQTYRKNNNRGLDPVIILIFNSLAMIFVVICVIMSVNYNDN